MTKRSFRTIFSRATCVALAAVAIQAAGAQDKPFPPIRVSARYVVKADRAGDLAAAIKEYNGILKKMNWDTTYTVWRSQSGPGELIRVYFVEKWADLDQDVSQDPRAKEYQVQLVQLLRRITDSFESTTREIEMVDRAASTPRAPEPPKMLMVWTAHVKQDKMRDAIEAERNEYAPAAKAAGIKAYIFSTARFGAPNNQISSSMGIGSWAEMDSANPIRKAMGDEKYRAFSEKMGTLLEDYRYDVYRLDPDLSYIAAR